MYLLTLNNRDQIPKMCTKEMVDSTNEFISVQLLDRVRQSMASIDDIVGGDPEEEIRKDLSDKSKLYSEAIAIIDQYIKA